MKWETEVYCTQERPPTAADADFVGDVLAWNSGMGWFVEDWRIVANAQGNGLIGKYAYWCRVPNAPLHRIAG